MKHLEHNEQVAVVQWLTINKIDFFAVPNGGQRNAVTGAILKKEGVKAGVSDLVIFLPNIIIFLEMKAEKGRQSDTQKAFERIVDKYPYAVYRVAYSAKEAIEIIQKEMK